MEVLLDIDYYLFTLINKEISNAIFDTILPLLRNKYVWYPFYIVISSWLITRKGILKGSVLIISLISCVVLTDICSSQVLKKYVRRVRPCNSYELIDVSITRAKCRHSFSFPSSHATNHFAIATFIILIGGISFFGGIFFGYGRVLLVFHKFMWGFIIHWM